MAEENEIENVEGGAEVDEEDHHQISIVVGVFGLLVAVILDIIAEIPFAGDLEDVPVGIGTIVGRFLGLGNVQMMVQAGAMIIRAIPFLQEAPGIWTLAWLTVWGIDQFAPQKLKSTLQKTAQLASVVETGGAGAAEAEGAIAQGGEAAMSAETTASGVSGAGAASAESAKKGTLPGKPRENTSISGSDGMDEAPDGSKISPEDLGEETPLLGKEGKLADDLFRNIPKDKDDEEDDNNSDDEEESEKILYN